MDNKKSISSSLKTKQFKMGGYSILTTIIVVAIIVLINVFVSYIPVKYTYIDTSSTQLFTISEQTESVLKNLKKDVDVYWIVQEGNEDTTIEQLLKTYDSMSSHFNLIKKDPDLNPTFTKNYVDAVNPNSLIVQCGDTFRYVDYYDMYVETITDYFAGTYDISFAGENELTSAVSYVVNPNTVNMYMITGHGELSLPESLTNAIEKENITVKSCSLISEGKVPEDADMIMLSAPAADISEAEMTALQDYLLKGGKMILITFPPQGSEQTNIYSLMSHYGVSPVEGIVFEGSEDNIAWNQPYDILPVYGNHSIIDPLKQGGYYVLVAAAQGLVVNEESISERMGVSNLLTTTEKAYSKVDGYYIQTTVKESGDIDGPFSLAVAITDKISEEALTKIVWIASDAIISDEVNSQVSGGNYNFLLNCLNWACDHDESGITIHSKSMNLEYLIMPASLISVYSIVFVGLIPLAYMIFGVVILIWRKRQ